MIAFKPFDSNLVCKCKADVLCWTRCNWNALQPTKPGGPVATLMIGTRTLYGKPSIFNVVSRFPYALRVHWDSLGSNIRQGWMQQHVDCHCVRSGYTALGDKQSMVSVEVTRYGVFRLHLKIFSMHKGYSTLTVRFDGARYAWAWLEMISLGLTLPCPLFWLIGRQTSFFFALLHWLRWFLSEYIC